MSSIKFSDKKVEGLWNHHLNNAEFISEMENGYYRLLISNYGPKNGLTLIRNSAGSDYLTSSSQKILEQLSFFHPCFKFINALISAQNKTQGVHGLVVGALCSGLLVRLLKNEELVPHRVNLDISEWIQHSLYKKLFSKPKAIVANIELSKVDQVLCIVRSILQSKSQCLMGMNSKEIEHIAVKVIEAFLKTIPEANDMKFGSILTMEVNGTPSKSAILDGLLYREPNFNESEVQIKLQDIPDSNLKIIIFKIPLSDDIEEKNAINWNSELSFEFCYTDFIFHQLNTVLADRKIHIIASQKYINDSLRFKFEREGYLVLERLGTKLTKSLLDVGGFCSIASFSEFQTNPEPFIGCISSVKPVTIGEKTYLKIIPSLPYKIVTFLISCADNHAYEFLKEAIESCLCLLRRNVGDSSVVAGGGCFESFVCIMLKKLLEENLVSLSETYETSFTSINMVFGAYIETFLHLSIVPSGGKESYLDSYFVDCEVFHLWKFEEDTKVNGDISKQQLPAPVKYFCSCKCMSNCDLPPKTRFVHLVDIRNTLNEIKSHKRNGDEHRKNEMNKDNFTISEIEENVPEPSLQIRSESIVDSFTAKMEAVRLAFDGVAELSSIGRCIFDK